MEREIPRDLSSLDQVAGMLQEFADHHGLSEKDRFSLSLAIERWEIYLRRSEA